MGCEVEIFGQKYALRADADEEHVRKVARFVDRKMREVASGSRSVSTLQIAVLAALDIASEYLQVEAENRQLDQKLDARTEAMVRRISDLISEVCAT